jgi:hypothetical protein
MSAGTPRYWALGATSMDIGLMAWVGVLLGGMTIITWTAYVASRGVARLRGQP